MRLNRCSHKQFNLVRVLAKLFRGFNIFFLQCIGSILLCLLSLSTLAAPKSTLIKIEASPLQDALVSTSKQMQMTIYADFDLIKGKTTQAINGRYTPEQVLSILLKDLPLSFQLNAEGVYVIVPKKEQTPVINASKQVIPTTQNKTNDIDYIIVTGQRLWNADNGLERKKNWSGNNAFLSENALNQSPSSSISDALTMVPSVVAYSDMRLGQAATGESEYLAIRNMGSEYTSTFINGIQVRGADQSTRALSLKMLTPHNLGSVRVLKTPTTEWGSENIGGAINIVTPSAFPLGKHYLSIQSGLTYSELNHRHNFNAQGKIANITYANVWGENHAYGLYVSAYQQEKYSAAESIEAGQYVPTSQHESNILDLRTLTQGLQATDIRFDFYHSLVKRSGGNLSLEYKGQDYQLFLRANISRYNASGYDVQTKLTRGVHSLYDKNGQFNPQGVTASGYFQTRDQQDSLKMLQLGGQSTLNKQLNISYHLSAALSQNKRPNYVESSLNSASQPGYFDFRISEPAHITLDYDSAKTQAFLLNAESVRVRKFQGNDVKSQNAMYDAKFELNYQPTSFFDLFQAGIVHNRSNRKHYNRPLTGNGGANYNIAKPNGDIPDKDEPQGPKGTDLAGKNIHFMDGIVANFRVYDRAYFENSLLPIAYQDIFTSSGQPNPGPYTLDDFNRNTIKGSEYNTAWYIQGTKELKQLKIVSGLRYEDNQINASHWDTSGQTQQFIDMNSRHNVLLPNVNIRYQYTSHLLFRAAARKAISRPAFDLLTSADEYTYDSSTDQITDIYRANPGLKPESAINYDFSIEWYPNPSSVIEMAFYSKKINNLIHLIQTEEKLAEQKVSVTQAVNGKHADLQGIDFHLRHQFDYMSNLWRGLGIDMSATLQKSHADNILNNRTDIPKAPNENYKIQLFHQTKHLLVGANWLYTGKQLLSLTESGLDKYLQASRKLDLFMTYRLGSLSASLQIENILDNTTFYKTLGKDKTYLGTQDAGGNGSFVNTGRFARLLLTYRL